MMTGVKIITVRGETYVLTARPGGEPVDTEASHNGEWLYVTRGPKRLGLFPVRNIEALLPIGEIEGEVVS